MRFAPEYVRYVLNDNFEDAKRLFLSPLMAIHCAHLVMLADRAIVSDPPTRVVFARRSIRSRRTRSRTCPMTAPTRICSSTSKSF